jgi:type VI secretion system protein ImpA
LYDLSHLLQPIDAQPPCGVDCEYDQGFLALSQAVAGKAEQQFGDTVIAAVEPDWRLVEQMASELLGRTKDLRVAAWLTQAATQMHGMQGYAAGIGLIHQLCDQYWDDVHPRMVIDGEDDPYMRINALGALSDGTGSYADGSPMMQSLRSILLVNKGLPLTIRDIEQAITNDSAARYADTQIVSVLTDALADGVAAIGEFEMAARSIAGLGSLIESRMSTDRPDFSALNNLAKSVTSAITRARVAGNTDLSEASSAEGADASSGLAGAQGVSAPGEIRSRDDVRRTLQRVCTYLERYEPSNPASLFARRAEHMLDKSFLDIVRELSPDTVSHMQMLTGAKSSED